MNLIHVQRWEYYLLYLVVMSYVAIYLSHASDPLLFIFLDFRRPGGGGGVSSGHL